MIEQVDWLDLLVEKPHSEMNERLDSRKLELLIDGGLVLIFSIVDGFACCYQSIEKDGRRVSLLSGAPDVHECTVQANRLLNGRDLPAMDRSQINELSTFLGARTGLDDSKDTGA